jgi:2-polyprenyl-6-methoxyphenol hydroxylase-like FAD-dependent oxidoreductase
VNAAHAHSPAGDQGIKTSMQDALNLVCKLARTVAVTAANAS